jgi:hypothetical protein
VLAVELFTEKEQNLSGKTIKLHAKSLANIKNTQ